MLNSPTCLSIWVLSLPQDAKHYVKYASIGSARTLVALHSRFGVAMWVWAAPLWAQTALLLQPSNERPGSPLHPNAFFLQFFLLFLNVFLKNRRKILKIGKTNRRTYKYFLHVWCVPCRSGWPRPLQTLRLGWFHCFSKLVSRTHPIRFSLPNSLQ